MPIKWKAIKPRKFNNVLKREIDSLADNIRDGLLEDYEAGVEDWDTTVEFEDDIDISKKEVVITVETDNEIYAFVHDGTKPHEIKPKTPGGVLRFQGTYDAKTTPGVISSKKGGSSGSTVTTKKVNHPGTKARDFTSAIIKHQRPIIRKEVDLFLQEIVEKSGHKI